MAAASVPSVASAFNHTLIQFVEELAKAMPDEMGLGTAVVDIENLAKVDPKKPMQFFRASVGPYSAMIEAEDPALFEQDIKLPGDVDIAKVWEMEQNRSTIWNYLKTLWSITSMVSAVPEPILDAMDKVLPVIMQHISPDVLEQSGEIDARQIASKASALMSQIGPMLGGGVEGSSGRDARAIMHRMTNQLMAGALGAGRRMKDDDEEEDAPAIAPRPKKSRTSRKR